MNVSSLSVDQLKRAVVIKEEIESLQKELNEVLAGGEVGNRAASAQQQRGGMSPAARAKIAAAQRARWAKQKGSSSETEAPSGTRKRRPMSPAARAKIAAAAKARWKKAKAAGKTTL